MMGVHATSIHQQIADAFWPGQPALAMACDGKGNQGLRIIDLRALGTDRPPFWCPALPTHLEPRPRVLTADEADGAMASTKKGRWPKTSRVLTIEVDYLIYRKKEPDEQHAALQRQALEWAFRQSGMPASLVVDSGGKSLHFTFFFSDPEATLGEFWSSTASNYLVSLALQVFGSVDAQVALQSGRAKWVRFPGGLRDGVEQTVLHLGAPITVRQLQDWLTSQLIPEAATEILSMPRALQRHPSPDKDLRRFPFDEEAFRRDLLTECREGERGTGWMHVAKKLAIAGHRPPSMLRSGVELGGPAFDASFLWHFSAYVFHMYSGGWFYSTDPADWTDLKERVRWWSEYQLDDVREQARDFINNPPDYHHSVELEKARRARHPALQQLIDLARRNSMIEEQKQHEEVAQEATKKGLDVEDVLEIRAQKALGETPGKSDKSGFDPLPYVQQFLGLDGAPCRAPAMTPPFWDNRLKAWRMFNGRHWVIAMEEQMRGAVQAMMGLGFSRDNIEKVYTKAKWASAADDREWRPNMTGSFPCENGTVYFDATTGTSRFVPNHWSADDFLDVYVPRNYIQGGTISPRLHTFLRESFGEEDEYILAKGVIGYVATPYQAYQRWFLLEGTGGNGKSVFIALLRRLYGSAATTAITMARLGTRFGIQNVPGKLIAYDDDASSLQNYRGEETDSIPSTIKRWTGGQECEVDQKGLRAMSLPLPAKLFALVNKLPSLSDDTDGTWRRMMPFKWTRPLVPDDDVIPNFENTLLSDDELDSFWSHCFETFLYLAANKKFRRTPGMEERCHSYRIENDSVMAFAEQYIVPCFTVDDVTRGTLDPNKGFPISTANEIVHAINSGKHVGTTTAAIHDCYKKFCTDELGQTAFKGRKALTNRLKSLFPQTDSDQQRRNGNLIYGSPDEARPRFLEGLYCTHPAMTNLPGVTHQQGPQRG